MSQVNSPVLGRCKFRLILGNGKVDDSNSETCNQASRNEHPHLSRSSLQRSPDDYDYGADPKCATATGPSANWL